MRILEAGEVMMMIEREELSLQRAIDNHAPGSEIMKIEASKAIWERVLDYVKDGEIVSLDENCSLQLHFDVPRA